MTILPELFAQRILAQAIVENRAAEMLECLFEGGSVTLDSNNNHHLLLVPGSLIQQLSES